MSMIKNIVRSIAGNLLGFDEDGYLVGDGLNGFRLGAGIGSDYKNFPDISRKVTLFDDFTSAILSTASWGVFKGSDGAAAFPAIAVANNGTVAASTSGAGTSSMAVSGAQLNGSLNWKASNGALVMESRAKLSSIASVAAYIGFTDQTAALEMPANSSGSADGITTNMSDGAGFLFDTSMTTTKYWAVGVAADTDAVHASTGIAPVADTYNVLRVEISPAGVAKFWIDGVLVATLSGAVTAATALTPVFAIFERTTAVKTLTADYAYVQQKR